MPRVARSLRLLGSVIQIKIVNSAINWGSYAPGANQIQLSNKSKNGARLEHLIHEAIHAILEKQDLYSHIKGQFQTASLDEHEEELVKGLTPGILSLLVDNGVDLSPLSKLVK